MPPKGEYDVQPPPASKDHSMRMCVMTLLIFFFICLVLLLVPLLLKKDKQEKKPDSYTSSKQQENDEPSAETTSHENPKMPPVSTTLSPTNKNLSSPTKTQTTPIGTGGKKQTHAPHSNSTVKPPRDEATYSKKPISANTHNSSDTVYNQSKTSGTTQSNASPTNETSQSITAGDTVTVDNQSKTAETTQTNSSSTNETSQSIPAEDTVTTINNRDKQNSSTTVDNQSKTPGIMQSNASSMNETSQSTPAGDTVTTMNNRDEQNSSATVDNQSEPPVITPSNASSTNESSQSTPAGDTVTTINNRDEQNSSATVDNQSKTPEIRQSNASSMNETSQSTPAEDTVTTIHNRDERNSSDVVDNQSTTVFPANGNASIHTTDLIGKPSIISDKECRTGDCKNLASRVMVMMNHSADKCEDYYEYACGGLRSYDFLLEDDPQYNVKNRIQEKMDLLENENSSLTNAIDPFYKYYTSCINYYDQVDEKKRADEAKSLLLSVGRFFSDKEWNASDTHVLTETIYNLMKHNSAPLFDVLLDIDSTNPSKYALQLITSETPFIFKSDIRDNCAHDTSLYTSSDTVDLKEIYTNYTDCIKSQENDYIFNLRSAVELLSNETIESSHYISQLAEVMRETWSKSIVSAAVNQHEQLAKKFESKTVGELKTELSMIDWELLFNKLLEPVKIHEDTVIQVYSYDHFIQFFNSGQEDMSLKLHNGLLAMFAHDLWHSLVQTAQQDDRGSYCLELADSLMEEFSAALYVSSFGKGELDTLKAYLEDIFFELKNTLVDRVENSTALDETAKKSVIGKVDAMALAVPATHVDESYLHQRMAGIDIDQDGEKFFENTVKLMKRYRTILYSDFIKNPKEPEQIWTHFILPHYTVGISLYGLNTIAVPLGIAARRRNFHRSELKYLKQAYLGGTVGRLVTRHFASTGVKYDATGKYQGLNSLISTATFTIWNESYFINTQETWTIPDGRNVSLELDDELINLWMDELIADQSGFKLALETYRRSNDLDKDEVLPWLGMDNEELFFLSAAQVFCTKSTLLDNAVSMFEDEHLPPSLRVNFFISNSYDLRKDICSEGTKMNPNNNLKVVPFPEDRIDDSYGTQM